MIDKNVADLTITVSGKQGSGKTTLALLLINTLKNLGIPATLLAYDGEELFEGTVAEGTVAAEYTGTCLLEDEVWHIVDCLKGKSFEVRTVQTSAETSFEKRYWSNLEIKEVLGMQDEMRRVTKNKKTAKKRYRGLSPATQKP